MDTANTVPNLQTQFPQHGLRGETDMVRGSVKQDGARAIFKVPAVHSAGAAEATVNSVSDSSTPSQASSPHLICVCAAWQDRGGGEPPRCPQGTLRVRSSLCTKLEGCQRGRICEKHSLSPTLLWGDKHGGSLLEVQHWGREAIPFDGGVDTRSLTSRFPRDVTDRASTALGPRDGVWALRLPSTGEGV